MHRYLFCWMEGVEDDYDDDDDRDHDDDDGD